MEGGTLTLLNGSRDGTVPLWCSEKFLEAYGNHATLQVVEGENHTITRHRKEVVASTVAFFQEGFRKMKKIIDKLQPFRFFVSYIQIKDIFATLFSQSMIQGFLI